MSTPISDLMPEPPDLTRIEFEHWTDVYGAWRDDAEGARAGWATLARAPGGVSFHGIHWCTDHAVCRQAEACAAATVSPNADQGSTP